MWLCGTDRNSLFAAGENDEDDVQAADNDAEPMMKKNRLESDFEQLFGPHFDSGRKEAHSTPAAELQGYLATPQIPTMENPLQWWARNQNEFPHLTKLAYRYLAVPATSTPSERVFSLAGNTITRQRASLHPAHVDTLIFLHENLERKAKAVKEEHDREFE